MPKEKRKDKVVFRRIKGRVIPIRSGKYKPPRKLPKFAGVRAKKQKPLKFTETMGFKSFIVGGAIAGSGQTVDVFGRRARDIALKQSLKARKVPRIKALITSATRATKIAKFSRKLEFIGLGIQALGLGAIVVESIIRKRS